MACGMKVNGSNGGDTHVTTDLVFGLATFHAVRELGKHSELVLGALGVPRNRPHVPALDVLVIHLTFDSRRRRRCRRRQERGGNQRKGQLKERNML
jgi:hypothetical protein